MNKKGAGYAIGLSLFIIGLLVAFGFVSHCISSSYSKSLFDFSLMSICISSTITLIMVIAGLILAVVGYFMIRLSK